MANETITVTEAGAGTNIVVLDVGRQAAAASKSLATCTEDKAVLDAIAASLATIDSPDKGSGTGGTETQRVIIDTAQLAASVTSDQASNAAGQIVRIPPQEVHLGEVGGNTTIKTITMTATTTILASADIIADTQQLDAAFRKTDGTGVLQNLVVFDLDDNPAFAFDVYVHRTNTSMGTENSAISITAANAAASIIDVISFAVTDVKDLINCKMYSKKSIGLPVSAVSGTDDLYFSIVNGSGTPTFAGGSIPMVVGILRD